MAARQFWHHCFIILSLIFVFLFPSVHTGSSTPKIRLENTVFVALSGKELIIDCDVTVPANQTEEDLTCFNLQNKPRGHWPIPATKNEPISVNVKLKLKNLSSGKYHCQYKTARVYWYILVRDNDFIKPEVWDETEIVVGSVFTSVLLVFSVIGSVYVFRGHWKEPISESHETGGKQEQNGDERKQSEPQEDTVDVTMDSSTSFYASLEPRPRSIYDVLDHTAANREPEQSEAKPKKQEPRETMAQTRKYQHDEDIMECVYENL